MVADGYIVTGYIYHMDVLESELSFIYSSYFQAYMKQTLTMGMTCTCMERSLLDSAQHSLTALRDRWMAQAGWLIFYIVNIGVGVATSRFSRNIQVMKNGLETADPKVL